MSIITDGLLGSYIIAHGLGNGSGAAPTTATLSGPSTSVVGSASSNFTITLDQPAQSGGVSCVVTSSGGGDTITTSPVVIAQGVSTGTFTITASASGARTITLASTTPSLTIAGSPITLTASSASRASTGSILLAVM